MGDSVIRGEYTLHPISESNLVGREDISNWVSQFIDKLCKEQISIETGSETAIAKLFMYAVDNGKMVEGPEAEEYINDIALKMAFQIMLKGTGNDNIVTIADVKQLTKDLFGDAFETQTFIKEENKVNEVAGRDKSDLSTGNDIAALDVLKASDKYPTKKDNQNNTISNMFSIDKATNTMSESREVGQDEIEKKQTDNYEARIIKRKEGFIFFKTYILHTTRCVNPNSPMIDRLVMTALIDENTKRIDQYFAGHKNPLLLDIELNCINKKINELLNEELVETFDIDVFFKEINLPEELVNMLMGSIEDFLKYLDELMADARKRFIEMIKKS